MSAEANSTTLETELENPPPEFAKRVLTAKQKKRPNFRVGQIGEHTALKFLEQKGWRILDTNVELQRKEVDIIAFDKKHQEVVFVEVKKLKKGEFGHPSQAVNKNKLQKMSAVARRYVYQHQLQHDYRFDIITVTGNTVEHFENVSWDY